MAKTKHITLIAGTESTRLALLAQLNLLLDNYVEIDSYSLDGGLKGKIKSDLIILSTNLIVDECIDYIDKSSPVIIARRTLDISNIDKVFSIPKDSTVLLVNDAIETATETIELLEGLGIRHINYIPYYPKCNIEGKYEIALTPGETDLVPSYINNIVDLGPRTIDLTTIVEILNELNLLDERAHFVSAKYLETIVKLSGQLYNSRNESNDLNEYLFKVLNQVNEGIVVFDEDNKITVFNEKAEIMFKTRYSKALGRDITQIVKDNNILYYILDKNNEEGQAFKLYGVDVVISKFHVEKLKSTVCTVKNAQQTLNADTKLRKILFKKGHIAKYTFDDILGVSQQIKSVIDMAKKLSKTDLTILIDGESGTGKELFASAIHNESPRAMGPFLAINFSSLSEDLVESELFGYEEGAFTGAKKGGKVGLFEQANGGTIFLDEIGDTSLKIQSRLLRVIQEKEIMRVGGTEIIPIDVRIIAATNKNLPKRCRDGGFREDLYFRLKNLYLKIPPLRYRKEDIPILIQYFLTINHKDFLTISDEVMDAINLYDWPGNIRELENLIEYMMVVCDGDIITLEHVPQGFFQDTVETQNNISDNISPILTQRAPLEDFHFILNEILEGNNTGQTVGRKFISKRSKGNYHYLSEEQVRYRADILSDLGLICKTRGRTGMVLTEKGRYYIHHSLLNK